jgi:hypothetical protein
MRARLLLPFLLLPLTGCALVSRQAPPECMWFDVVVHPGGGIPASLGYYLGAFVWAPVGVVAGGLLPAPADEAVALYPGHWLGTAVGGVLGAPFHLIALPFGSSGPPEDPPVAPKPEPSVSDRPDARTPPAPR